MIILGITNQLPPNSSESMQFLVSGRSGQLGSYVVGGNDPGFYPASNDEAFSGNFRNLTISESTDIVAMNTSGLASGDVLFFERDLNEFKVLSFESNLIERISVVSISPNGLWAVVNHWIDRDRVRFYNITTGQVSETTVPADDTTTNLFNTGITWLPDSSVALLYGSISVIGQPAYIYRYSYDGVQGAYLGQSQPTSDGDVATVRDIQFNPVNGNYALMTISITPNTSPSYIYSGYFSSTGAYNNVVRVTLGVNNTSYMPIKFISGTNLAFGVDNTVVGNMLYIIEQFSNGNVQKTVLFPLNTQCNAIEISRDNKILSVGYNAAPWVEFYDISDPYSPNLLSYSGTKYESEVLSIKSVPYQGTKVPTGDWLYSKVSSLISFNGDLSDDKGVTWTPVNGASISSIGPKFGTGCLEVLGVGGNAPDQPGLESNYMGLSSGNRSAFTIEGWVYVNGSFSSAPGTGYIYRVGGAAPMIFAYANPATSEIVFRVRLNGTYQTVGIGTLVYDQWIHFAFVRYNRNFKAFVNGVEVGFYDAVTAEIDTTTFPMYLGTTYSETEDTYWFSLNGKIDEFRVTEGVSRYISNFTVPSLPYDKS